jgi:hypothetical protein
LHIVRSGLRRFVAEKLPLGRIVYSTRRLSTRRGIVRINGRDREGDTRMAILEDIFKGGTVTGLAVGVGALLLVPTVLPAVGRVVRPAVKAAIKGGMVFYRETVAEVGEMAGDLFAEARAELEHESAGGTAGALPGGSGRGGKPESH